ncbi:Hypothetical_protein [Hexamita inflata]|uniref:Hypothetical_protein n=1 Tax=Hexamita inflata TaxID=28002 RepID=A0AA86PPT5_9EUKA|nr:Hypothetical protein HINF_LOCUS31579 [Hexamita inflata]
MVSLNIDIYKLYHDSLEIECQRYYQVPIIVGKNCTLHKESHLFLKELKVNMQTFYAEIGYKISRYAQICNNSLQKKRNPEKTNLEETPIGKLDMNKFAPLEDLGEDNDKSEKEFIEKFQFQQNKWNNSHVSQSDSNTFTSQMGENRRRKSNHQKANTSTRQGYYIDKTSSRHQTQQTQKKEYCQTILSRIQTCIITLRFQITEYAVISRQFKTLFQRLRMWLIRNYKSTPQFWTREYSTTLVY